MAISSNMTKQWHENRPPQTELFRVVKLHFCQLWNSATVTCIKYNQTENPNIPKPCKYRGFGVLPQGLDAYGKHFL